MKVAAVLLAAGSSSRMGRDKLTLIIGGESVLSRSFMALRAAGILDVVIVVSQTTQKEAQRLQRECGAQLAQGGATRGESVLNGLRAVDHADVVVIHDGARCLVSPEIIKASVDSAAVCGSGVAALDVRDTIRDREGESPDRSRLLVMQTPQSFDYQKILAAYEYAFAQGLEATDDCTLYERMWGAPQFTPGGLLNQKLTCLEDLNFFEAVLEKKCMRTGYGEDTHRLVAGRKLILGGMELPYEKGLEGHSDADVLTHAVIDALLGAAALGDIGRLFPDSDMAYQDICSLLLLKRVGQMVREKGYEIANVDVTVVAQEPKLAPHMEKMQSNLAAVLGLLPDQVSVKATTPEHMGPEGNLECITARSVCLLEQ